jgi:uncharacterized protein YegJ (DUF2314 family)
MKLSLLLCLVFSLGSAVRAQDGKIDDQTRSVSGQDRAMNAAIAQARSTFDDFLALAKNPPPGASGFKIKVMVSDDSGIEHLWFAPFKEVTGGFAGVLVNEPTKIKSMKYGSVYGIRREQITDWGYVQDGKQKGSFTVCALFLTMDKGTVERYKRDHGFECP